MVKKDAFGKNKNRLGKKAAMCTIAMILMAVSFAPLVSSGESESPEIEIIKTGPSVGYVGDEITYTFNVSNTGDVPLSSVNVNDDRCGQASYVSGDENDNDKLDTDEVWIFTSTYTLSSTSPNPLVNTATASGEWDGLTVEDVDDWSVEVHPESEPEPQPTSKGAKGIDISSSNSYFGNSPPVANASGPYYGVNDEEIEFDGSKSYDQDGIITHYGWTFGDGNTGYGEVVTHTYSNGGSFLVTLTISDNNGSTDTDKTIAFISVPNRPPSIPKILGPTNGSKDTKYSYAAGSTDLDKDDINYIIDWGDDTSNESGFLPSGHYFSMLHSWAKSGEYNITVTASDDQSATSSEMTVLIEENIITDNIVIVALGMLAIIVLLISLLYIKKGKKE